MVGILKEKKKKWPSCLIVKFRLLNKKSIAEIVGHFFNSVWTMTGT
jgi:hypothetical protein